VKYIHVLGGLVALFSGALALYALKGATLHRKSGMVFVYAMLIMGSTGALMALLQPRVEVVNVIAGVLTVYLVSTALLTVRRPLLEFQRIDAVGLAVALTLCLACLTFGVQSLGKRGGLTPVYFMFGTVSLLAAVGDVRLVLGRRAKETNRIARHLWRMCFAFFIAVASFFLGPPRRLPPFLRGSPLRPLPVLLVVGVMIYWLVQVRLRQRLPRPVPST
jgi:hypothetical protein